MCTVRLLGEKADVEAIDQTVHTHTNTLALFLRFLSSNLNNGSQHQQVHQPPRPCLLHPSRQEDHAGTVTDGSFNCGNYTYTF